MLSYFLPETSQNAAQGVVGTATIRLDTSCITVFGERPMTALARWDRKATIFRFKTSVGIGHLPEGARNSVAPQSLGVNGNYRIQVMGIVTQARL